ncbi:hypothetical protein ABFA07_008268 [Porites harrisoni]
MIFYIILLAFIGLPMVKGQDPSAGVWTKISHLPVCVKARDNGYGFLQYYGESKLLGGLKLQYVSGEIRCVSNEAHNSRWGCSGRAQPLNIIITDETNHVIFPLPEIIKNSAGSGLWYSLPFVNEVYSDELVFANFGQPLYLPKDEKLRFWYGDDLKNHSEGDNQGQVCFHVFALFM